MIKETKRSFDQIIGELPANYKVLDAGASFAPTKRANYIIDFLPYEEVRFNQAKGPGEIKFTKETYVKFDICSRQSWSFPDKFFDYSICSHTLEDIRDPLWVCSELIRVSKAGYIEVPSSLYERTFGIEARNLAGNAHHRWLVDMYEGKLRFSFKHFFIHSRVLNHSPRKKDLKSPEYFLKLEWQDGFEFYENWFQDGRQIFSYFLQRPVTEKQAWQIYRKMDSRNFFVRWLSYFKQTTPWGKRLYSFWYKQQ